MMIFAFQIIDLQPDSVQNSTGTVFSFDFKHQWSGDSSNSHKAFRILWFATRFCSNIHRCNFLFWVYTGSGQTLALYELTVCSILEFCYVSFFYICLVRKSPIKNLIGTFMNMLCFFEFWKSINLLKSWRCNFPPVKEKNHS